MIRSVNSTEVLSILNIAFYQFVQLPDVYTVRRSFKETCAQLDLKGTILVSSEGINGTLAGLTENIRKFQDHLRQDLVWSGISYKESYSDHVPFQKMLVKLKKEIIPLGDPDIKPAEFTAPRISAQDLKQWLDEGKEFELLDTRNDYEIEFGTFQNATHLNIQHFRDFPNKLKTLSAEKKQKPLVMFCTGGIRCEKASVVALRQGFQEVYQLDGGILKYFEECGEKHYQGACFVFDERVALDSQLKPSSNKKVIN